MPTESAAETNDYQFLTYSWSFGVLGAGALHMHLQPVNDSSSLVIDDAGAFSMHLQSAAAQSVAAGAPAPAMASRTPSDMSMVAGLRPSRPSPSFLLLASLPLASMAWPSLGHTLSRMPTPQWMG